MNLSKNRTDRLFQTDDNAVADVVTEYANYEAFLDSQISEIDQQYLQDSDIAREFVELGYRGAGHAITRKEFQERKQRAEMILRSRRQGHVPVISDSLTITAPLAKALALREEANRTTQLLTIIFLRIRNEDNHEISGYIDYAHRLKYEDLTKIFLGDEKFHPMTTDLSFYDWHTHQCTSNETNNFHLSPGLNGIRFRCVHDRKLVHVDPESKEYGDGTIRTVIDAPGYLQVVLYDHYLRRKKF